ncbi:MAG: hypothetical protein AAGP08_04200 [Pseudomonadota bacterium]
MDLLWNIQPSPASTAGLAMMFIVIIYWLRHPDRLADRAGQSQE